MNESPAHWCWASIAELGEVTGGLTQNSKREKLPLQMPYLRVANVYADELRLEEISYIGVEEKEVPRALLKKGDLLVVEGNGSLEQIGRVAVWDGAIEPCLHQNHLIKVRFVPATLGQFALHWFLCSFGREQITRVASSTSGLHTLSISKVQALKMPLAPIAEQELISEAIESYFSRLGDAVATLERVERNLKRYRASVLKAAVEGRLVPTEAALARQEGRDYEPASVLLERILTERRRRWSESGKKGKYQEPTPPDTTNLPKLPEGWCWATVDMLADVKGGITKGQTRSSDTKLREVPYLRVANVQRGYLDLSEVKTILATEAEIMDLHLEIGDVLFNEGGDRDKLGRGWVWAGELPECIHQNHVFRARLLNDDIQPRYLSWFANGSGQVYFFNQGKQTTNLASINLTKLKGLPVPIPPKREQARIVDEIDRLLTATDSCMTAASRNVLRARRTRQAILSWAFEGKLADQDPSDEPASVLLERIKAERATATPVKPPKRGAANKKARA